MRNSIIAVLWVSASVCLSAGCEKAARADRKTQLQQVARGWCQTITASQVMPVYPLTEDLQPGDVFLVPMSVEEQRERFDDNGFLPLDHHLVRLAPEGYEDFYGHMFVVPADATSVDFTRSLQRGADGKSNWTAAPAAGFPSYSFSVSRSGGMNVGIPISGVPVGMSLLNASQATGTVSIQKANTIGTDVVPLSQQLDKWAQQNAAYLLPYARDMDAPVPAGKKGKPATDPGRAYLRIVSRIFLTGAVDISMADARSGAAGLDAGKPRPVDLLTPSAPGSMDDVDARRVENMRAAIASLNAQLAETETPTRASGSNAGVTPAEMDERAKAKQEAIEEASKARQKELDKANEDLAKKRTAAAADQKALDEARAALKEKKAALKKITRDPDASPEDQAAGKKAVEEAQKLVESKADTGALKELAKFKGIADVAKSALDQVASMIPGGSLRVTSASSRFVTMRQDFNPPLVIGFHAFDQEIRFSKAQGLHLGPPIATQRQILNTGPEIVVSDSNNTARAIQLRDAAEKWYAADPAEMPARVQQLTDMVNNLYPDPKRVEGFAAWSQTALAPEVELVLRAVGAPIPPKPKP